MPIEYYHISDIDVLTRTDGLVDYYYNKKSNKWEVDQEGVLLARMSELDTCLDLLTKEEALAKIEEFKRESRINS